MLRVARILFIAVCFSSFLSVAHGSELCPDDAWVQRGIEAAARSRDNVTIDHTNRAAKSDSVMENLEKCFEKFQNIKATTSLGLPSLGDVFAMAGRQVCSSADSLYNQAISSAQQQVMLPGNVVNLKASLPGAGQLSNPVTPVPNSLPVGVTTGTTSGGVFQESINKTPSYIRGIFQ